MGIRIRNVSRSFGDFRAIDDLSLDVETGSLVALLGPSGCGKSTLLRMVAGLEPVDRGQVFLNGADATTLSVQERHVGFVFQHFALFKHLTVRENIGFGLRLRRWSAVRVRHRVEELLQLVQLQSYAGRYPFQLSGGQRQRVSLARALAVEPQVLLLDEPFSALDAKVRKELRVWLRNLQEQTGVTTVIVTHDQEEAMEVADRIVVMNAGRIEQIGSPAEIYDQPATPFVMRFVGEVNELFPNEYVRPQDLELHDEAKAESLPAVLKRLIHLGKETQAELLLEDGRVIHAQLSAERAAAARGNGLSHGARLHVLPRRRRRFG
jgi:sulfate transport system ATP-binding protein